MRVIYPSPRDEAKGPRYNIQENMNFAEGGTTIPRLIQISRKQLLYTFCMSLSEQGKTS